MLVCSFVSCQDQAVDGRCDLFALISFLSTGVGAYDSAPRTSARFVLCLPQGCYIESRCGPLGCSHLSATSQKIVDSEAYQFIVSSNSVMFLICYCLDASCGCPERDAR